MTDAYPLPEVPDLDAARRTVARVQAMLAAIPADDETVRAHLLRARLDGFVRGAEWVLAVADPRPE